jgi:hypothetical protein
MNDVSVVVVDQVGGPHPYRWLATVSWEGERIRNSWAASTRKEAERSACFMAGALHVKAQALRLAANA